MHRDGVADAQRLEGLVEDGHEDRAAADAEQPGEEAGRGRSCDQGKDERNQADAVDDGHCRRPERRLEQLATRAARPSAGSFRLFIVASRNRFPLFGITV